MKKAILILSWIIGTFLVSPTYANQIWGNLLIVDATEFIEINDPSILILDARKKKKYDKEHPANAIHVYWSDFSKIQKSEKGELLQHVEIAKKLGKLGISSEKPIIIVDDALKGWGESGRIAWMLRELGHTDVAIIDGGIQALKRAGFPMEKTTVKRQPTSFHVQKATSWSISIDQVAMAKKQNIAVVDTREKREYKGWTPYGESRGGHVPGAKHLYYRDLVDKKGMLKGEDAISEMLKRRGITKTTQIAAYCTGGIRSAWMVVVLRQYGYNAYNYAGSMWQWSARDKTKYPLSKKLNPFSD